jgi:CubicO group peptidase (beta-lactamase class C family)
VGESYTLRQLRQHTSSLPDYGGLPAYHHAVAEGITPWSRRELLDRVNSKLLRSMPGQRFAYSNIGHLIVRTLIEETTGLDLADALHQLVFAPIGLDEIQVATLTKRPGEKPVRKR